MISVAEAVVLGVVQGITEFLPVSSSGHLAVTHRFLTPLAAHETAAVDVALHVGTLAALVAYFWRDLWEMLRALAAPRHGGWRFRWIGLVAIGTLPAAVVALPARRLIGESFGSMPIVGLCFLLTGALLYLATAVRGALRTEQELARADALVVGAFQAAALLPGISRAGSTVAGGLFRRLRGDVAARFSLMMAIPAITGAEIAEAKSLVALGPEAHAPLLWGVAAAGVTGFAAIWLFFRVVRAERLHYFAYYLWTVGGLVLVGTAFFGL